VPVVSFTFGVPERAVVDALRAVGSLLVQTVTCGYRAARTDPAEFIMRQLTAQL
jgi:NAD(P)H-dependent flavin oxidoreductase YrpB (nitropropane dioxygenase family)